MDIISLEHNVALIFRLSSYQWMDHMENCIRGIHNYNYLVEPYALSPSQPRGERLPDSWKHTEHNTIITNCKPRRINYFPGAAARGFLACPRNGSCSCIKNCNTLEWFDSNDLYIILNHELMGSPAIYNNARLGDH